MITEDYCSYEVAKLLKEKGFEGVCDYAYSNKGNYFEIDRSNFDEVYCLRPTPQMAMAWLRENCNLAITIEYQEECSTWKWRVNLMQSSNSKHTDFKHYTYEEAVEAALKYCLENLI